MKKNQIIYVPYSLLIVAVCSIVLSSFILKESKGSELTNHQPILSGIIKGKPVENTSEVFVKIDSLVKITSTSAICYYTVKVVITGDDKIKITGTGVNVMKPGSVGSKNFLGRASAGSNYKAPISGLAPKSIYNISAYATSNKGTDYSTSRSFGTESN